jgi:molybdopterin molybdotransferase
VSGLLSVEDALAAVLALARPVAGEAVALRRAGGRVLAAPVVAGRDQPPFPASAMDGYAIRDADHAPGAVLRVVGEAAAGRRFAGAVGPGEAVRIFTGAPVPEGAGRVVLQEDVARDGDRITLGDRLEAGTHVRAQGQDFATGAVIAAPRRLRPQDLALIAAMNVAEVTVARRPVVALIATGDELVMPGEAPSPDQIIASNSFALAAMAEAEGAEVRMLPIARDRPQAIGTVLDLANDADLIVTIGGASVGEHDLIAGVLQARGMELAFHKIAMRPGKPLLAGRMGAQAVLGLPGNPVSAIVCGHLFLLPLIRAMLGLPDPAPRTLTGVLTEDVAANGPRAHYMRARIEPGDGVTLIRPFARQDSALLSVLAGADALLVRPVGDPGRAAGARVSYLAL